MRENTVLARMWVWAVRKRKIKKIYDPQLNITTLAVMCGARVGQTSDRVGQAHPGRPVEPGLVRAQLCRSGSDLRMPDLHP